MLKDIRRRDFLQLGAAAGLSTGLAGSASAAEKSAPIRLGVIGVGNVGSKVAKKADALGMKVLLNDPPLKRQTGEEKYRLIEELYGCDFITMHTPLATEGLDRTLTWSVQTATCFPWLRRCA